MRESNVELLNDALVTIYRSLPMFIGETHPYSHVGDEKLESALAHIVADQKHYSSRLADLIMDLGGAPVMGCYPIDYTDLHLLSLDYLMKQIVKALKRDVATLQGIVAQLDRDTPALALAEEVLGNTRGHLESLGDLLAQPVVA